MRIRNINDIEHCLRWERNAQKAFELSQEWLEDNSEKPYDLRWAFKLLRRYGLPAEDVVKWIDNHLTNELIDDIVEDYPGEWKEMGVNVEDYINVYLTKNGDRYFFISLAELPERISVRTFLDFYPMDKILEETEYYGFAEFINDYCLAGGDIQDLADKLISEIGYVDERVTLDAFFDLVEEDPGLVDLWKLVECIDYGTLDADAKQQYYNILKSVGTDPQLLRRFLA